MARMKPTFLITLALAALPMFAGCNRGSKANVNDVANPAHGSANEPKNMGDTRAKTNEDGRSPSASPTGLSKDAKPGEAPPPATGGATK